MTGPVPPVRWRQAPGVILCEAEDQAALLVRETWDMRVLDPIARRVWDLLAVPRTVEEIVGHLTSVYEVNPDRCRADLEPVLQALRDAGAVTLG